MTTTTPTANVFQTVLNLTRHQLATEIRTRLAAVEARVEALETGAANSSDLNYSPAKRDRDWQAAGGRPA